MGLSSSMGLYYETICGGSGAGNGFKGASAIQTHMTNSLLTDPEVFELRYPVMIDDFHIRAHSGGEGWWQGGNGVVRQIRFLEPMSINIKSNRRSTCAEGLAGGLPGQRGENYVIKAHGEIINLAASASIEVDINDTLVIATLGGGGYGKPQG